MEPQMLQGALITRAPMDISRKVAGGGIAGSILTVVVFLAYLLGFEISEDLRIGLSDLIVAVVTVVTVVLASYQTRDRSPDTQAPRK